jgi:hypothetical protein
MNCRFERDEEDFILMCGEYRESEAKPLMHVKRKANKPLSFNLCKKTLLGMAVYLRERAWKATYFITASHTLCAAWAYERLLSCQLI